ncbi:hypothetical protein [Brevibacillus formosus]|uniref:hypothetical protein n=2 Tax=Brevibacillus formosus TaxID=54913 RepID=UPI003F1DD9A4
MDRSESTLSNLTQSFMNRISNITIEDEVTTIGELRLKKRKEQKWNKKSGIYYFVQDEEVKYVGRATPSSGLGERIYIQIGAFGGKNNWDTVIKDDTVKCVMIVFPDEDWHWLAGLEVLLIDKMRPQFNYRT